MTNVDEPDDSGTEPGGENDSPVIRELRKQIREQGKQIKNLQPLAERADAAERKLAFAEAGIDLADPKNKYFVAGYDGELEADKIKAAAIEGGFLSEGTDQTEQQPTAAEAAETAGFERVESAVVGSPLPEGRGQNLLEGMTALYEQGGQPEDIARYLAAQGYPVAQGFEG